MDLRAVLIVLDVVCSFFPHSLSCATTKNRMDRRRVCLVGIDIICMVGVHRFIRRTHSHTYMSFFPSIFCTISNLLYFCMERTSYVFSFRMVFFYLVTTGCILYFSLLYVRIQTINQINQNQSITSRGQERERISFEAFHQRFPGLQPTMYPTT